MSVKETLNCSWDTKLGVQHKTKLSDIEQKMKDDCFDETNMIGDFKMKFEPMSSRETTLDHYSKRGISWYGFCLMFYLSHSSVDDDIKEEKELD